MAAASAAAASMNNLRRLQGKVAIITGAASGLGEAAARLFAANGSKVIIADIKDELGRSVADSIGSANCCYRRCDVTDEKQVEEVVAGAVKEYGRLDVMFSNALKTFPVQSILELDMNTLDSLFAVQLRGTAACIKHAGKAMTAAGNRGSIICTGSGAGVVGGMGSPSAYTAVKHGLIGLVKATAGELGAKGVRVNCVSPAGVATPGTREMTGMSTEAIEAMFSSMVPLKGPILRPKNIADAALFLASNESEFINGHNLVVDGGCTVYNLTSIPFPK